MQAYAMAQENKFVCNPALQAGIYLSFSKALILLIIVLGTYIFGLMFD